jgi:hypothetical protein
MGAKQIKIYMGGQENRSYQEFPAIGQVGSKLEK